MIGETIGAAAVETIARGVIERASPKLFEKISARVSQETLKAKVQFTKTFQSHLANSFERSFRIKTVISRDKPVALEDIYVPLTLESNDKEGIPDIAADPSRTAGARYILSGTGGAGKTVLMKHLLNISKDNALHLVPLFIELRNIEFDKFACLEDCIYQELKSDGARESKALFIAALEEGLFVIYLDGFDEIHPEESTRALEYTRRFSDRYKATSMLITTRPKTGVVTLRDFTVFHVEPLSKESAILLIDKTDFDELTKSKFIKEMRSGLYEKHQTLMSLPILVAMMLLAFRTYADIPDRMTVFYSQAFETLYSIHDAENKELFKRQHHAGLAPDVFRSVLQTFCYLSLSNHDIEFSEATLNNYIKRALSISQVDVSTEKYRNDLIHNVCVLQPDGLSYVFVHRSFQEYFAALFALIYSGPKSFEIIDKIVDVSESAVASMLLEINRIKTERNWVAPKVTRFRTYLEGLRRRKIENQMRAFFTEVWIDKDDGELVQSYGLGKEGASNYRILELLSECSGRKFGYNAIIGGLQIPNESQLAECAEKIDISDRLPGLGPLAFIFHNARVYRFAPGARHLFDEHSNFKSRLANLLDDVRSFELELRGRIDAHINLEDSELFS